MSPVDRTAPAESRPKVLVVDDAPVMLEVLEAGLGADYQILGAINGPRALELCQKARPDLILLDVDMPEMDGYQVCQALKKEPNLADIPVIFMTGHEEPDFETRAFLEGAVDFLTKPIRFQTAKARINCQIRLGRALSQLQQFKTELEVRVAKRTSELEHAIAELTATQADLLRWQAKATLTTLVASVSHDLGTPIGNALIASSTVQKRMARCKTILQADPHPNADLLAQVEVAARNSQLIETNLERAGNLLSNFHRTAVDQVSEKQRSFDLATVVHETINSLNPSLRRHPHQLVIHAEAGIKMDSYPGALSRVLINLVNNAYHHAFREQQTGRLEINCKRWGEYADIEIQDDGVGIAPEVVHRIFDPFYTTQTGPTGAGLGLAIAKGQVVEVMRGAMTVTSEVGKGTRFRLILPLDVQSAKQGDAASAAEAPGRLNAEQKRAKPGLPP